MNRHVLNVCRRIGIATRVDVGHVKAAAAAVATVDLEARDRLEARIRELEDAVDLLTAPEELEARVARLEDGRAAWTLRAEAVRASLEPAGDARPGR